MSAELRSVLEAALVAAVLVPVACSRTVRAAVAALGTGRRLVLGAMLALALAAQFALGTRAFPFVDWKMYSSLPDGDPIVYEYDVELSAGRRDALVPGRYMGRESADRFVERLRRDVEAGDPAAALRVLASVYETRERRRVVAAIVSARTVSIADGRRGAPRERLRVAMP